MNTEATWARPRNLVLRIVQLHGSLRHRGGIERRDYRQHDFRRLNLENDAVNTSGKRFARAGVVFEPAPQHDLTGRSGFPNLSDGAEGVVHGLQIKDKHVGSAVRAE